MKIDELEVHQPHIVVNAARRIVPRPEIYLLFHHL